MEIRACFIAAAQIEKAHQGLRRVEMAVASLKNRRGRKAASAQRPARRQRRDYAPAPQSSGYAQHPWSYGEGHDRGERENADQRPKHGGFHAPPKHTDLQNKPRGADVRELGSS